MIINTDLIYPIGSIYLSVNETNPSKYFGGTWVAWGTGRVPVGVDTAQNEFAIAEKTGGEKTHKLTIKEMPSHNHLPTDGHVVGASINGGNSVLPVYTYHNYNSGYTTGNTGDSQAHNNLQPYITCYMWKRTA